mmetsp:Transcript_37234/g.90432  ORF Transcript_37234/g.90432 Transcript_37234/m.90432 type:complete len:113 (+) Transcript_37234:266-604(+)
MRITEEKPTWMEYTMNTYAHGNRLLPSSTRKSLAERNTKTTAKSETQDTVVTPPTHTRHQTSHNYSKSLNIIASIHPILYPASHEVLFQCRFGHGHYLLCFSRQCLCRDSKY